MARVSGIVLLLGMLAAAAAGQAAKGDAPMALTLTSAAFSHQGEIPRRYTCEGEDVSPPLAWSSAVVRFAGG